MIAGSCTVWNVSSGAYPCPLVRRVGNSPGPKPPSPAPPSPPMRLVVDEQFDDDELNTSLWNVLNQPHCGGFYSKDNAILVNGSLVLRTVAQNISVRGTKYFITSGAVNTAGRLYQRRGRWEARVKLPRVAESPGYTLGWVADHLREAQFRHDGRLHHVLDDVSLGLDAKVGLHVDQRHDILSLPHL
eukprot:COSAG05_NODE_1431_length_4907_cov_4.952579_7_plen_187_part_00